MPRFRIVIEDTQVSLRFKVFEAGSLDDAMHQASDDPAWDTKEGWQWWDSSSVCQIREDQCVELRKGEE